MLFRSFCLCKPLEYGLLFMNHNNPRNAINGSIPKGMGLGLADLRRAILAPREGMAEIEKKGAGIVSREPMKKLKLKDKRLTE